MNDLVPQNQGQAITLSPPRSLAPSINAGAVAIEQERAIAEVRGELILAKQFPRSLAAAIEEFSESCRNRAFAMKAFYAVPNRGNGPSIRFAEEAARCYGNFSFGHRELSRDEGKSEVEVWAWDKEKNNRSTRQITVMHVVDTKNGQKKLTDQADIDNKIANVASKQVRGRILALLPKSLTGTGEEIAKATLAGNGGTSLSQNIQQMVTAFAAKGIKTAHLEAYLGHKVDNTDADELAELRGVYNAIAEGAKIADYFKLGDDQGEQSDGTNAVLNAAKAGEARGAKTKAEQPKSPPPPPPPPPVQEKAPPPPPAPEPETEKPAPEPESEPDMPPAPPPAAEGDLF